MERRQVARILQKPFRFKLIYRFVNIDYFIVWLANSEINNAFKGLYAFYEFIKSGPILMKEIYVNCLHDFSKRLKLLLLRFN
jgi:hypothetical protein